jgi:hypothetical protein
MYGSCVVALHSNGSKHIPVQHNVNSMIANVLMCQCLIMLVDRAIHFRYVFPYVHPQQCRLLVLPHVTMSPNFYIPQTYIQTLVVSMLALLFVLNLMQSMRLLTYMVAFFFSYAWSVSQDMSRIGRYFEGAFYRDASCEVSLTHIWTIPIACRCHSLPTHKHSFIPFPSLAHKFSS